MGEFIMFRSMHKNVTNALASTVHFILDAVAAFLVALFVQRVRSCHKLQHLPDTGRAKGLTCAAEVYSSSHDSVVAA